MNRDEVLEKLRSARTVFDEKVAAVPPDRLDAAIPGHVHTVGEMMVGRLRAAHEGRTTGFDRDRVGWEQFNERVWDEAAAKSGAEAVQHAGVAFDELVHEIGQLNDAELNQPVGVVTHLDPAWLEGRALWELIGIDGFDHYAMHYEQLDEAARGER
jgi:hypothetical protein